MIFRNIRLQAETLCNNDLESITRAEEIASEAVLQLREYFSKSRRHFDVPLRWDGMGTPFQVRVWKQLMQVPFGHTATYGQIATK